MKLLCRIGWHNWGKWGDPLTEIFKHYTGNGIHLFDSKEKAQSRYCTDCGLRQKISLQDL